MSDYSLDDRANEGLRRENTGLVAQRLAAIQARKVRAGWRVEYVGGVAASMRWGWEAANV